MSRFYATIQGNRGPASRCGHSEITGHIRGWDLGGLVRCYVDDKGRDVVVFQLTGGSNRSAYNPGVTVRAVDDGQDGPIVTIQKGTTGYLVRNSKLVLAG